MFHFVGFLFVMIGLVFCNEKEKRGKTFKKESTLRGNTGYA